VIVSGGWKTAGDSSASAGGLVAVKYQVTNAKAPVIRRRERDSTWERQLMASHR
jgi:hypothetical protein